MTIICLANADTDRRNVANVKRESTLKGLIFCKPIWIKLFPRHLAYIQCVKASAYLLLNRIELSPMFVMQMQFTFLLA